MFHIGFFYFLAGMTFNFSLGNCSNLEDYKSFVYKKASRLLPGFLFFIVLVFIGKATFQYFGFSVGSMVTGLSDILYFFLYPNQSFSEYFWFIYVLFLYYLTVPIVAVLSRRTPLYLILFVAIVCIIPVTKLFALDNYQFFLIYFVSGYISIIHYKSFLRVIDRIGFAFLVILLVALIFQFKIPKLIVGLISIPGLYWISSRKFVVKLHVIATIGKYSFSIYLMHLIVIGVVFGLLLHVLPLNYYSFVFYAILLSASGISIPIYIKRYVSSRWALLDKLC